MAESDPDRGVKVTQWSVGKVQTTLRCANLLNGIGMVVAGSMSILTGFISLGFETVTVAAYIGFFGLILCCAELRIQNLQERLQENCGFLFSYLGRSAFILFAGTMCFGLGSNWVAYLVGTATLINGFFNLYVLKVHPAFKTGEISRTSDPYQNYTGAQTEMVAYLKANPELARKAGKGAASFAAHNPDLVRAAMAKPAGGVSHV